jgi:hypothetical protein
VRFFSMQMEREAHFSFMRKTEAGMSFPAGVETPGERSRAVLMMTIENQYVKI